MVGTSMEQSMRIVRTESERALVGLLGKCEDLTRQKHAIVGGVLKEDMKAH